LLLAEPLPLPQGGKITAPWQPMLSLTGMNAKPEEAAGFRVADDPNVGRALVVGPWLAGSWYARVQYKKPYPPADMEIHGVYRTVDLLPYAAAVRADFYDTRGKRLTSRLVTSMSPTSLALTGSSIVTSTARSAKPTAAWFVRTAAFGRSWYVSWRRSIETSTSTLGTVPHDAGDKRRGKPSCCFRLITTLAGPTG
jgi:hypothetical protein